LKLAGGNLRKPKDYTVSFAGSEFPNRMGSNLVNSLAGSNGIGTNVCHLCRQFSVSGLYDLGNDLASLQHVEHPPCEFSCAIIGYQFTTVRANEMMATVLAITGGRIRSIIGS